MKRGFRGAPRPLLPSMLLVATNPNAGQEHAAQVQSHTSTPPPPPIHTPTPTPPPIPTPTPIPNTEPHHLSTSIRSHLLSTKHFHPHKNRLQNKMSMDDLLQVVPELISRIDSLETDLKQTKLTMGNAIVKLVKKVKKLEGFLKRRNMVLSDSEEEEPEVTGEKVKMILRFQNKDWRYKRRKEAKGKKVVSSLDFQEEVDTGAEQVNTAEGVSTGSTKLSTGSEQVSTVGDKKSTSSPDKGQRAGKAPMIIEETPKKSKEQVLQEEASLAEDCRRRELNEHQKKRKAQVQFEAQHYTNEDWDLIRAKIEANAELSKSMLGSELQGEDFAKKMVDLVNQRKKYFAEERARAKRNKPMTQSQLKNLSFEEVKKEFNKLVKQKKTPKRLKDDEDVEAKDDEPTKKSGKRRKQMARKGLHTSCCNNRYGMDGPEDELEKWMVYQLTKFHVQRVDMVINPPWNLPFLGAKGLTSPEQTATVEMVFSRPWTYTFLVAKGLTTQSEWLTGKETSNPFKIFNDSPLTGVNTPGSDENRLKLYDLM
ncbi:hypothetical protein Tco_0236445 [Tanacetum coccineum]